MPPAHPDLNTLFSIPNVYHWGDGVHLAPDGKTVAFMWNKSGRWQLYTLPITGGEARPIVQSTERVASPRWSPDGERLAYLQDYSGDENFDLFVLNPSSGEARNLTPNTPDEAINQHVRWLPDGSGLAYVSNRDGHFATYLLSIAGGVPKRLTEHEYSDLTAHPSPDGKWLAVETMTLGQAINTLIVPLGDGEPMWIGDGSTRVDASSANWSPESRRIAFASDAKGSSDIGVFDLVTRSIAWLTDGARECYYPVWSPDSKRIAYVENHDGDWEVVVHTLNGGAERYTIGPGLHTQLEFTPDGQSLLLTLVGPDRPADLWTLPISNNLTTQPPRQLTHSLPAAIDPRLFVSPTHVYYPSLDAGINVPALLYVPKGAKKDRSHPGVLYVHGGPTAQHDNDFFVAVQDLVMRGYVVLASNYRGSTGYGKMWREANRFDIGRADTNDVVAGADYLGHEGWCDPKRIGITGISHGGYLTMTGVTFHPDKFAAGSALVPYVNWFTEHANERADLQYWDMQNMGDPERDADRWRAMSPIFFIDRITAPVQVFASGHDPRCPLEESEQIRDEMHKRGRTVELHVYPDEGHVFSKLESRVDAYAKRAAFFDKYLNHA